MNSVEIAPSLLPVAKQNAQLYAPRRWLVFTKNPADLCDGYAQDDILCTSVAAPALSDNAQKIWNGRFEKLQLATKRHGEFLGMHHPRSTGGVLGLDYFRSGFLDWRCTLPIGDEYDARLEQRCLRPPVNIHHAVITIDDQLLYVTRGTNRESWAHAILGLHSWGVDIDKDYACSKIMEELYAHQGMALFSQAQQGICREFNPFEQKDSATPNVVLDEIISRDDVAVKSLSCLTLHLRPYDMGYHACFTATVNKEAGDLLEKRKQHPVVGRISGYYATPFTEENMVDFFKSYHERIATSIEPAILMACVQRFGEGFISRLPYEAIRQR